MNIPMIAIWGNENYPATVRMLGTQATNGKDVPIGGTDDEVAVKAVDALHDLSATLAATSQMASFQALLVGVVGVIPFHYYHRQMKNYQIAQDYWGGQFQSGLDWMIGAKRYEYQERTKEVLVCDVVTTKRPIDDGSDLWVPDDNPDLDCYIETQTYTVRVTVSTPSDGLIPKESQIALTGVADNCIVEMPEHNHQQMKKSRELIEKLEEIFAGDVIDDRDDEFFIVNKR